MKLSSYHYLLLFLSFAISSNSFSQDSTKTQTEPPGLNIYISNLLAIEGGPARPLGNLFTSFNSTDPKNAESYNLECKVTKIQVFLGRGGKMIDQMTTYNTNSFSLYSLASSVREGDKITVIVDYKLYKNNAFFKTGKLVRKVNVMF